MTDDDIMQIAAGVAGRLTKLPEPVAYLGLRLAKLAVERSDDPEQYLRVALATLETEGQAAAKAKFG